MSEATAIKVIELFEKHGKEPGADFDEDYFFDFLTDVTQSVELRSV
jgi:hypothetical protein